MSKDEDHLRSRIQSLLWDFIHRNKWQDHDDFSLRLTDRMVEAIEERAISVQMLQKTLTTIRTNFFVANKVGKQHFVETLIAEVTPYLHELAAIPTSRLTAVDIFPEILSVGEQQSKERLDSLNVEEKRIQDWLRNILSAKKASPMPGRMRDSGLEVADIEEFTMPVNEHDRTFVVVVKGYRSVLGRTLSWKDISHQVTRAFQRTRPDYLVLVSAKDPADGLITSLDEYARSVKSPNLVVFVTPRDLVRLLVAHGFLS